MKKKLDGRPTTYREEYLTRIDEYLEQNKDEYTHLIKSETERGYTTYENKLRVNLPSKEKYAKWLGVAIQSMYEWEKKHPNFSEALKKILVEQKHRLIDMGLSGDYNSTIAKLMLSHNHGMHEKTEQENTNNNINIEVDSENILDEDKRRDIINKCINL